MSSPAGNGPPLAGFPLTVDQVAHLVHLCGIRPRAGCRWCLQRCVHGGTGIPALDRRLLEELAGGQDEAGRPA